MGGRASWRGGLSKEQLEVLVTSGCSIVAMASELGVSAPTVRHWLRRYGLQTERSARLAETKAARATGASSVRAACPVHGPDVELIARAGGGFRCLRCRSDAVVARRRRVKEILLREAGGACVACGYARSSAALHFHHLDPETKSFSIAHGGVSRSIARARDEAAKCVLLCANCHAEVESGIRQLGSMRSHRQVVEAADPG